MLRKTAITNVVFALSFAGVGLIASAGTVRAQSINWNWTGFSIYGGVGGSWVDGDISVSDTTRHSRRDTCEAIPNARKFKGKCRTRRFRRRRPISNDIFSNFDSEIGILGTIGVGADIEPIPGLVVGVFADVDMSNAEGNFSATSTNRRRRRNTILNGEMEHDYSWTIGWRAGLLSLDRSTLVYVLAGYSEVNFDNPTFTIATIRGRRFPAVQHALPDQFEGLTLGVGTEVKLSNVWSLKLEGRYTDLNSQTLSYANSVTRSIPGRIFEKGCKGPKGSDCQRFRNFTSRSRGTVDIDPEIWSARIVLSFKLN